jgi:cytochrome P450
MLTALLGGYDTTSTVLGELLVMLQDCPTAMQRIRQEQQQVVAAHGEELSAAVLSEMPYLTACIRCVHGSHR